MTTQKQTPHACMHEWMIKSILRELISKKNVFIRDFHDLQQGIIVWGFFHCGSISVQPCSTHNFIKWHLSYLESFRNIYFLYSIMMWNKLYYFCSFFCKGHTPIYALYRESFQWYEGISYILFRASLTFIHIVSEQFFFQTWYQSWYTRSSSFLSSHLFLPMVVPSPNSPFLFLSSCHYKASFRKLSTLESLDHNIPTWSRFIFFCQWNPDSLS